MPVEFGGLDLEVFLNGFDIGADKDGAMVEALVTTLGESVAGEFPATAEDIVAAGKFGLQAIVCHGTLEDGKLAGLVVQLIGHDEGEIEIAQIVKDRATSRAATHQKSPVGLQEVYIALGIGILELSNDNGTAVGPEVKGNVSVGRLREEILLNGNVEIGIGLGAEDETWQGYFCLLFLVYFESGAQKEGFLESKGHPAIEWGRGTTL
jgi:hypothetical protein